VKIHYVYEHWRPDTNVCFYVGKGSTRSNRAYDFKQRNKYHLRIIDKLNRQGMEVEVRIVTENLTKDESFNCEIARIAFWRSMGIELVNQTRGGDGMVDPSPELRSRLSISQKKRFQDPVEREKSRKGATGRVQSAEEKEKRAKKLRGGRRSLETRTVLSTIAKARGVPRATIEAGINARRGKSLSAEHKASTSASMKEAWARGDFKNRGRAKFFGYLGKLAVIDDVIGIDGDGI
jgi:hypothetical protein